MAHVLLEEGKKKNWLPIQTIKSILMTGSEKLGRKISTPVVSLKEEAERKVRKMHSDAVDDLKELITGTQKAYDDVQKMAEERIGIVLKALSGFSGTNNEIKNLRDEVKKLRKRVENLEKTLKEHR
jgi:polyhydroxyalkanoate synthesis regulator phasin